MRTRFKDEMPANLLLWLHLAARRAGEDDRADFAAQAAKLDRGRWPRPLVSYFLGEVQQDTVWAAIAAGGEDNKKARTCEANFYLGEAAVADGNIDAAQDSFAVAITRCTSNKVMQFIAKTERERLEAKPQ